MEREEKILTKWVNRHGGTIVFDPPREIANRPGYTLRCLYIGGSGLCAAVRFPNHTDCSGLFCLYSDLMQSDIYDSVFVKEGLETIDFNLF